MGSCKSTTGIKEPSTLRSQQSSVASVSALKQNFRRSKTDLNGEVVQFRMWTDKLPGKTVNLREPTKIPTAVKNYVLVVDGLEYRVPQLQDVTQSSLIRRRTNSFTMSS